MSFVEQLNALDSGAPLSSTLSQFRRLLEPKSPAELELLANKSVKTTRAQFGRTMRLFAPIYLSNECVNNCSYCGFSRDNPILRTTLSVDQVVNEAKFLAQQGFRHILLVAGEHPKFVSEGYLEKCLESLRESVPTLAIEVGPMETPEYKRMVDAGCEGLVVYQETYHRGAYAEFHTAGPKKRFDWRLECPERGYKGGFRRIGIGALMGLADWRYELLRLAAHLEYLYRTCWKSTFTISLPRLRPAAGNFKPEYPFSDAEFVQALCAFRLCFPQVGIILSTREPRALRDALFPLGITSISAGSHTEPGGYTGEGADDVHLTVRGRRVEVSDESAPTPCNVSKGETSATGQFDIADERSPSEIAAHLSQIGLEPVWKDWDPSILSAPNQNTQPRGSALPSRASSS
ncbi:MAG: 2-iminoacetate synthase ThiH [Verrucomicrobiales bacterium]|nr:2-iminoacetate synthase ThiH [Verrucomicrobiales bacterium]|tara:strand:+ start:2882 stop:4093 length:1212 start_codon:yes stop_codon:yes gene_type:complete